MHEWADRTLHLVTNENYIDRLQLIYPHEEGERDIDGDTLKAIRVSFKKRNEIALLRRLLDLEKFPYKDSYVGFLRKDRASIDRNPETVKRICDRLYEMGIESVISGVTQAKEANMRRGNQFSDWAKEQFKVVDIREFKASARGIVLLGATELEARDFCNKVIGLGITKRPDLVAKSARHYVVG